MVKVVGAKSYSEEDISYIIKSMKKKPPVDLEQICNELGRSDYGVIKKIYELRGYDGISDSIIYFYSKQLYDLHKKPNKMHKKPSKNNEKKDWYNNDELEYIIKSTNKNPQPTLYKISKTLKRSGIGIYVKMKELNENGKIGDQNLKKYTKQFHKIKAKKYKNIKVDVKSSLYEFINKNVEKYGDTPCNHELFRIAYKVIRGTSDNHQVFRIYQLKEIIEKLSVKHKAISESNGSCQYNTHAKYLANIFYDVMVDFGFRYTAKRVSAYFNLSRDPDAGLVSYES